MRQLRALFVLGTAFFWHLLTYPFHPRNPGKRWLKRLATESLTPTPQGVWPRHHRISACIACGLCEALSPKTHPMLTIVGEARRAEDAESAAEGALALREVATNIAKVCPAQVDVEGVAFLIEENVKQLKALR